MRIVDLNEGIFLASRCFGDLGDLDNVERPVVKKLVA